MTAAERSELAEFRQEMNHRFDSVGDQIKEIDARMREVEIAKGVADALSAQAALVSERKFSNTLSKRERLVGKAGVAVAIVLGVANILIHFL